MYEDTEINYSTGRARETPISFACLKCIIEAVLVFVFWHATAGYFPYTTSHASPELGCLKGYVCSWKLFISIRAVILVS